ncbi:lactose regulatory protein lac9 and GAL4-like protein [Saitoella coloradoensis]
MRAGGGLGGIGGLVEEFEEWERNGDELPEPPGLPPVEFVYGDERSGHGTLSVPPVAPAGRHSFDSGSVHSVNSPEDMMPGAYAVPPAPPPPTIQQPAPHALAPPPSVITTVLPPVKGDSGTTANLEDLLPIPSPAHLAWDERNATPDLASTDPSDGLGLLPTTNNGYLGKASASYYLRSLLPAHSISSLTHSPSYRASSPLLPHLPAAPITLTPTLEHTCVTTYFNLFHPLYPLLDESSFRTRHSRQVRGGGRVIDIDPGWAGVVCAVCSVGAWVGGTGGVATAGGSGILGSQGGGGMLGVAEHFFDRAIKGLDTLTLLGTGTLQLLQLLLILGKLAQMRDQPNTAFAMLGLARRMGLGLGLGQGKGVDEEGKRVWWVLVVMEVELSLALGRPNVFDPAEIAEDNLPAVVSDGAWDGGGTMAIQMHTLRASAQLATITTRVYFRFLSHRRPSSSSSYWTELNGFDAEIREWKDGLTGYLKLGTLCPETMILPRALLHWRADHLRTVMLRSLLLSPVSSSSEKDQGDDWKQTSLQLAKETTVSIHAFRAQHPALARVQVAVWYTTYFLFHAVLVPIASLLHSPDTSGRGREGEELKECVWVVLGIFEEMEREGFGMGRRCAGVVRLLLDKIQHEDHPQAPAQTAGGATYSAIPEGSGLQVLADAMEVDGYGAGDGTGAMGWDEFPLSSAQGFFGM